MTSSSGSIDFLDLLTKLRKTSTYVYQFIINYIINHIDEQPEEEIPRGSRRVSMAGAPVPMELGYTTSQQVDVFTNPDAHQILLFRCFTHLNL